MEIVLMLTALLVGGALATQAAANQRLAAAIGGPVPAAALQLAIAGGIVVGVLFTSGRGDALGRLFDVEPPWLLLAGLASPVYVMAGIVLISRVGALAAAGTLIAGQLAGSVILDATGFLQLEQRTPAPIDLLALAVVAVGVALIARPSRARLHPAVIGSAVLGLVAGAALPLQAAMNASLGSATGEPLLAAAVSFTVALLGCLFALAALTAARAVPPPTWSGLRRMPWWGWLGGPAAAVYVTSALLLVPALGASVTFAIVVAGQQVGAALVDRSGWFGLPRRPLDTTRMAGALLLLAGALALQFA